MTFLEVWVGYALCGATLFSLVFLWAVRERQFSNLDSGRYIPLRAAEEREGEEQQDTRICSFDRCMLVALLSISAAAVVFAIYLGITAV